jgi:hypothetical protein
MLDYGVDVHIVMATMLDYGVGVQNYHRHHVSTRASPTIHSRNHQASQSETPK